MSTILPSLTNLYTERSELFTNITLNISYSYQISHIKEIIKNNKNENKPIVYISGAGPSGLLQAIQSIYSGNPTKVIERYSNIRMGREQTVALNETTIQVLKFYGIYQYLLENKLIYSKNLYTSVRLCDLELAMKKVLQEIGGEDVIEYSSFISDIKEDDNKSIEILINLANGKTKTVKNINLLINCEGKNSKINEILKIKREEVLPQLSVINSIYKDYRPKVSGPLSLAVWLYYTASYTVTTIYFHAQFIFKFILSKNFRKTITGSIILNTPGQTYVGCGFSDKITKQLENLKIDRDNKFSLYNNADNKVKKKRRKMYLKSKNKYNKTARYWINHSICKANFSSIYLRLYFLYHKLPLKTHYASMSTIKSFSRFDIIKIGADKSKTSYKEIGEKGVVLLTGDATVTVDPTTGWGCNNAIQSCTSMLEFYLDYKKKDLDTLCKNYEKHTKENIKFLHENSVDTRKLYRPDKLKVE